MSNIDEQKQNNDTNSDSTILDILKSFPKYIRVAKEIYLLTIVKNEHEYNNNAWIVLYAKENMNSLSTKKALLKIEGGTLIEALRKMKSAYREYVYSKKNRW